MNLESRKGEVGLQEHRMAPINNPLAASTPSAQMLVSKTILQKKEPGILREISSSRMGIKIYKMNLGIL